MTRPKFTKFSVTVGDFGLSLNGLEIRRGKLIIPTLEDGTPAFTLGPEMLESLRLQVLDQAGLVIRRPK